MIFLILFKTRFVWYKANLLTLVDLSVPRNIPNSISQIKGVDLVNIDNLNDQIYENDKKRKKEIAKAEVMIDVFLNDFMQWTSSRQLRPSILAIKKQFNLLSSENDRAKFSNNLIKKIKDVSDNGKNENVIGIINKIFS
jgi:glutamyl-tRNA reductase